MPTFPTDLIPTTIGITSYATPPAEAAEAYATVLTMASPVDKIVGAFEALKAHVAALDVDGLRVLASSAQQIVLNGFHRKQAEALPVLMAAVARLPADEPPAPEGGGE